MGKMKTVTKSDCGSAKLLSAMFGVQPDRIKRKIGLLPPSIPCPNCGALPDLNAREEGKKRYEKMGYCSLDCYYQSRYIPVVCSECGTIKYRLASTLIWHANNPWSTNNKTQELTFCSKLCQGRYFGKHHGFAVHPENRKYRKHNYNLVWKKHIETGYGALRLGKLLGIKTPTVSVILRKMRKEINN